MVSLSSSPLVGEERGAGETGGGGSGCSEAGGGGGLFSFSIILSSLFISQTLPVQNHLSFSKGQRPSFLISLLLKDKQEVKFGSVAGEFRSEMDCHLIAGGTEAWMASWGSM